MLGSVVEQRQLIFEIEQLSYGSNYKIKATCKVLKNRRSLGNLKEIDKSEEDMQRTKKQKTYQRRNGGSRFRNPI